MRFEIDVRINDGRSEAPPMEVEVENVDGLVQALMEEFVSDHGEAYGPGSTITITRIK